MISNMKLAILGFMRQQLPHRTKTAHLNHLPFKDFDGKKSFSITFIDDPLSNTPSSTQTFPPDSKGNTSLFNPPAHYHILQDEYFRVISGQGVWHLWDDRDVVLKTGDEIMIPAWKYHSFKNHSETEPLVVGYWYDKEFVAMEERFFRNALGYLADCFEAKLEPSIFQLAMFGVDDLMVFSFVHWRFLPSSVEFGLNVVVCYLLALIGRWLLGYEYSYGEYFDSRAKHT